MNPQNEKKVISYGQILGQLHQLNSMATSLQRSFSDLPSTNFPKIKMIDANISQDINHFKDLTQQLITQVAAFSREPAVIPTTLRTAEEILQLPPSYEQAIMENNLKKPDNSRAKIYRSYTKEEKNHALELQKLGLSIGQVSKELGIPIKNIRRWCKESSKDNKGDKIDLKMELILRKWIHTTSEEVNSASIRKKAIDLSTCIHFKATEQWLKEFLLRHKVNLQEKKKNK